MSSASTASDSGDHEANAVYSATVHKAIVFSHASAFALLQLLRSESSWYPGAKASTDRGPITVLSFLVFFLLYVVLGVSEVMLDNKPPIQKFIGNISHTFGVIAALLLISLEVPIFTLTVFPLALGWFFFVIYHSLVELVSSKRNNSESPGRVSTV